MIYFYLIMTDFDESKESVSRVSVRIPAFWPEEPAVWFAQIEGQFALSRITTDETKFYYVISQLDHQYAKEVKDIITNPPETDKYIKLKSELIRRLSASQEKKVKQLLVHEELGDRKPSQFLRHLSDLAGPAVPAEFLKTVWSSRLPHNIQTVVALQMDLPLEKLGELADKVHEIAPTSLQVASTASTSKGSSNDLEKQISALTRQVEYLTKCFKNRERSRSYTKRYNRSGSRSNSRPRMKQPPPNHPHCFYHFTYGEKARKCKQPCTYNAGNDVGSRK